MREVVLDTETTGLNPTDGHRLLEIGAVEIVHHVVTGRVFHQLINPERDVPDDAVRVHGHTAMALKDKPVFADIIDDFLSFIGDAQLVIHNAEFDMRFVNAELALLRRKPVEMDRVVDTLALARKKYPGQPNSLDALCDRYRIDRSQRVKHGALLDAEILAEIYGQLNAGHQSFLSLDEPVEDPRTITMSCQQPVKPRGRYRQLIWEEETTAHFKHVTALGEGAVWLRYVSPRTHEG